MISPHSHTECGLSSITFALFEIGAELSECVRATEPGPAARRDMRRVRGDRHARLVRSQRASGEPAAPLRGLEGRGQVRQAVDGDNGGSAKNMTERVPTWRIQVKQLQQ